MKKTILILALTILLFACKKQIVQEQQHPTVTADAKRNYTVSEWSEPYAVVIWDSCINDSVHLSGIANYYIKESLDNGYYLDYKIDLTDVTGASTDLTWHGGIKFEGKVVDNIDGTDVKGKVTYKLKFISSKGDQIIFTQNARFILVNGIVKVDFNNITEGCK